MGARGKELWSWQGWEGGDGIHGLSLGTGAGLWPIFAMTCGRMCGDFWTSGTSQAILPAEGMHVCGAADMDLLGSSMPAAVAGTMQCV